MSHTPLLAW